MDVQMRHGLMSSTSVGLDQAQSRRLEYLTAMASRTVNHPTTAKMSGGISKTVAKCFFGMNRQ